MPASRGKPLRSDSNGMWFESAGLVRFFRVGILSLDALFLLACLFSESVRYIAGLFQVRNESSSAPS